MLLAWFDRARGRFLPQYHLLPGGQTLLAGLRRIRGGDIIVSLNDGEYVFILRGLRHKTWSLVIINLVVDYA